jgi:tRNA nucleotidyltransferase (CCA-adding enzyme)
MLMGVPSRDQDFVWTGATPEFMLALGMKKVEADFPVFLDEQKREHALARLERKTGDGYHGFAVEFGIDVTIEEDLYRRDLTINSIAMAANKPGFSPDDSDGWNLIDPYGGAQDIKDGIIRHTNPDAFREDPLRILRVARFLARWTDFEVHKTTFDLLKQMVADGMLKELNPDRVWKETAKALSEDAPSRYFVFLQMIGGLKDVFPEIAALHGVPQPFRWHPEGDCFVHTMAVLDAFSNVYSSPVGRFAALCHDLGKATSDPDDLPHHKGHEGRGVGIIDAMAERLPLPNEYKDIAKAVAKYHTHIHNLDTLNSKTIVKMFDELPYRKYEAGVLWILPAVSEADHRGRSSFYADRRYPNKLEATNLFGALFNFKTSEHIEVEKLKTMKPEAIREFNYRTKTRIVAEVKGTKNDRRIRDQQFRQS